MSDTLNVNLNDLYKMCKSIEEVKRNVLKTINYLAGIAEKLNEDDPLKDKITVSLIALRDDVLLKLQNEVVQEYLDWWLYDFAPEELEEVLMEEWEESE